MPRVLLFVLLAIGFVFSSFFLSFDRRVSIYKADPSYFRTPASVDQHSLFTIIRNDGEFLSLAFADDVPDGLFYTLSGPTKGVPIFKRARKGEIHQIMIEETGAYTLELFVKYDVDIFIGYAKSGQTAQINRSLWKQRIFAQAESDFTVSKDEIAQIASDYSPIVLMHEKEKFYPSSLEYIFNIEDRNEELSKERFVVTFDNKRIVGRKSTGDVEQTTQIEFSFDDIVSALAQFGADDSLIDIGNIQKLKSHIQRRYGNPKNTRIYYCYFERDRKLYIRYYFFYSFDPKNVLFNPMVTHIFDRESFTLVYDLDQERPDYLVYSSHLINQTIGIGNEKKGDFKKWRGGKLYLDWDEVPKHQNRPIVSIAEGSHALYPFPGNYGVYPAKVLIKLVEEAGGERRILVPENNKYYMSGRRLLVSYRLEDLQIGRITSESWNRMLGFSGNIIDLFSVPFLNTNLHFPPFTEREIDIYNYTAKKNTHHFDIKLLPANSKRVIQTVQDQLQILPE